MLFRSTRAAKKVRASKTKAGNADSRGSKIKAASADSPGSRIKVNAIAAAVNRAADPTGTRPAI